MCGILHYLCHYPPYDIYFFNGSKPMYFRYTLMQTMIFISMIASPLAHTFLHSDLHKFLRVAIKNNPPLVTCELEYHALSNCTCEAFWLPNYLSKWVALWLGQLHLVWIIKAQLNLHKIVYYRIRPNIWSWLACYKTKGWKWRNLDWTICSK